MALTKEEYIKRVKEKNPAIQIASEFKGANNPIQYICPNCHEVKEIKRAVELYTKKYKSCSNCQGSLRTMSEEDYLKRVKEINSHIEIVSEFKGTRKPIQYICPNCNKVKELKRADQLYNNKMKSCFDCQGSLRMMSEEDYLKRVKEINPHIQIVSEFEGTAKPIQYICPHCHEVNEIKSADNLYNYQINSCSNCKHLTQKSYLKRVKEINPHIQVVSKFKGTEKPIQYICPNCNEVKEVKRAQHLYNYQMNSCYDCKGLTDEEYLKRVKEVNPHLQIVSEFNGTQKPIQYICPNCYEVKTIKKAEQLYTRQMNSCKDCKEISKENYLNRVKEINPHIEIVSEFKGAQKPIQYICPNCYEVKELKRAEQLYNNKMNSCNDCKGLTEEEYLNRVKEINPHIKVVSEFKGTYNSIQYICPNCHEIKTVKQARYLYIAPNYVCPTCSGSISMGERTTQQVLEELNLAFETQKTFEDLKDKTYLRFDFYLPDDNICIEYQGKQHYEPIDYFGGEEGFKEQLKRDNLKRQFCKENNIKLIEIPYDETDIKEFLMNELNKENLKIVA